MKSDMSSRMDVINPLLIANKLKQTMITLMMCYGFVSSALALTLDQAVAVAIESDPAVNGFQASSRAFGEEAIADGTMPDPKLRLGMFNVPIDSFDLEQEPTTQLRLGIQQAIPRGNTLEIKQQRSSLLSKSARFTANNAKRKVIKEVRETYYELFYQAEAGRIIHETRGLFSKLVVITESQYASGRINQQDVIRAGLELARLDDRTTMILAMEEGHRATLAQWIDDVAYQPITEDFPELAGIPDIDDLGQMLMRHPVIEAESAKVEASKKMIEMARQDYSPGMNAFVEYRKRFGDNADGTERADMMAAMVTLDIPLFTANRQDRRVAANEEKASSARFKRDDKLRQLKHMYEKDKRLLKRLNERKHLYTTQLLKAAKNNAKAALNAYQAGVTEFTSLMRARITELDVRLADLRVRVDLERARARLLYITGEPS